MKDERRHRSGKVFFLAAVGLVFAAILATVLLARDQRNLDRLLASLGYSIVPAKSRPPADEVKITRSRGVRLPPAHFVFPTHLFADLKAPEQNFIRRIRSDPEKLCERLADGGFGELDWTVSRADREKWECSSFIDIGEEPDTQSSVFIFIKGDEEDRVTSFRVKLNIENTADTIKVVDLAGKAANIFLQQVRWENSSDIIGKIHALKAFDISSFGSRIQFKREFGDTPRYNFLANQIEKPRGKTPADWFFDRTRWFPLTDSDGVPMVDGMMAGENPDGWSLAPPPGSAP
ncbi:MAG TPA: DUF6030 family protein [Pararhizobium sp.]|uniref:DUF6030 family protein n=1 Tax=Pararhizobium sp. TaxID=1977563 RepID=UPI002B70141F|nr:DUF6030 family protein [Pararhizobium sp.]HTO33026.1 DUF6030 family protein [Pararhizobium sp.]